MYSNTFVTTFKGLFHGKGERHGRTVIQHSRWAAYVALKHLKKIDLILFGRLSFKNPSGYTRLSNSTHIAHITPSIFADFPSSHLNTGLSRIYGAGARNVDFGSGSLFSNWKTVAVIAVFTKILNKLKYITCQKNLHSYFLTFYNH